MHCQPAVGAIFADVIHEQLLGHPPHTVPQEVQTTVSSFVAQWLAFKEEKAGEFASGIVIKARLLNMMHAGLESFATLITPYQELHPQHRAMLEHVGREKRELDRVLVHHAFQMERLLSDPTATFRLFPPAQPKTPTPSAGRARTNAASARAPGSKPRPLLLGPSISDMAAAAAVGSNHPGGGVVLTAPCSRLATVFGSATRSSLTAGTAPTTPVAAAHLARLDSSGNVVGDDGGDGDSDAVGEGAPQVVFLWSGINGHTGVSVEDAQKRLAATANRSRGSSRQTKGRKSSNVDLPASLAKRLRSEGRAATPSERGSPGILRPKDWCIALELPGGVSGTADTLTNILQDTRRRSRRGSDITLRVAPGLSNGSTDDDVRAGLRLSALEISVESTAPPGVPVGTTTVPPVMSKPAAEAKQWQSSTGEAAGETAMVDSSPRRPGDHLVSTRPHIMQRGYVWFPSALLDQPRPHAAAMLPTGWQYERDNATDGMGAPPTHGDQVVDVSEGMGVSPSLEVTGASTSRVHPCIEPSSGSGKSPTNRSAGDDPMRVAPLEGVGDDIGYKRNGVRLTTRGHPCVHRAVAQSLASMRGSQRAVDDVSTTSLAPAPPDPRTQLDDLFLVHSVVRFTAYYSAFGPGGSAAVGYGGASAALFGAKHAQPQRSPRSPNEQFTFSEDAVGGFAAAARRVCSP